MMKANVTNDDGQRFSQKDCHVIIVKVENAIL